MLIEDLRLGDYLKIRNVKIFQSGKLTTRPKTCEINSLSAGPTSDSLLHVLDTATNTHFLIDTGAEVSLVPPTEPELEKPPSLSLIAAKGSPIKSYGTRCMDLHISKNRYTWRFQVAAVHKSILGADFPRSNGLLPNLRNRRLISLKDLGLIYGVFKHVLDRYKLKNIVYQATAANEFASLLKDRPELTTPTFSLDVPKHGVKHFIVTQGPLVHSKARRLSPEKLPFAKDEYKTLVYLGIARRSFSQFSSPLHMVTKPDGKYRACGDFRKLNCITRDDRYLGSTISQPTWWAKSSSARSIWSEGTIKSQSTQKTSTRRL